jgi:WD40 repeat protein
VETGRCLKEFVGHNGPVWSIAWGPDKRQALSAADDGTLRLWDLKTGDCLRVFEGHTEQVLNVNWQQFAVSASSDLTLRTWDVSTGTCLRVLKGHNNQVLAAAWCADQRFVLSGSKDRTIRLWDTRTGTCLQVLEGHTEAVWCVLSAGEHLAISASFDRTVRMWDLKTHRCIRVLEGHGDGIWSIDYNPKTFQILTASNDRTLRLWDATSGRCLCVFEGHTDNIRTVQWSGDGRRALSGDVGGGLRVWDLSDYAFSTPTNFERADDHVQYTNAKVLLIGESGVGKTGLSQRLVLDDWQPSDSTIGSWASHWKLPVESGSSVEREIWLWDFGGQADQRLIHQLYMDETSLAILVFDGQKDDLFDTLGQWDRDLARASPRTFAKLLVAGRVDAGGLRVSRGQIEAFKNERVQSVSRDQRQDRRRLQRT